MWFSPIAVIMLYILFTVIFFPIAEKHSDLIILQITLPIGGVTFIIIVIILLALLIHAHCFRKSCSSKQGKNDKCHEDKDPKTEYLIPDQEDDEVLESDNTKINDIKYR